MRRCRRAPQLLLLLLSLAAAQHARFKLEESALSAAVVASAPMPSRLLCAIYCTSLLPQPCDAVHYGADGQCRLLLGPGDFNTSAAATVTSGVTLQRRKGPASTSCPPDWILFNDRCYFQDLTRKRDQSGALEFCAGLFEGSELVSVHNDLEMTFLLNHPARPTRYQMLSATLKGGAWENIDGTIMSTSFPIAGIQRPFIALDSHRRIRLAKRSRSASELALCAWTPPELVSGCPSSSWLATETHCYLHVNSHITYSNAQTQCANEGGGLAHITDQMTHEVLAKRAVDVGFSSTYFFTGIVRQSDDSYQNSDGSDTYIKWGPSQPYDNSACGVISYGDATTHDMTCETSLAFVCSVARTSP